MKFKNWQYWQSEQWLPLEGEDHDLGDKTERDIRDAGTALHLDLDPGYMGCIHLEKTYIVHL